MLTETPQVCRALWVIQFQLPLTHSIGLVKLSLSHFIIRKAVEPSRSLRGKRNKEDEKGGGRRKAGGVEKKKKAVGRLHYSTLAAIYSSPTPKT